MTDVKGIDMTGIESVQVTVDLFMQVIIAVGLLTLLTSLWDVVRTTSSNWATVLMRCSLTGIVVASILGAGADLDCLMGGRVPPLSWVNTLLLSSIAGIVSWSVGFHYKAKCAKTLGTNYVY